MPDVTTKAGIRRQTISATVTRADGRVEELGIISFYDSNPFRRWWWRFTKWLKG